MFSHPLQDECPVEGMTHQSLPILIWPTFPVSYHCPPHNPHSHPSLYTQAERRNILLHLFHLGKSRLFCKTHLTPAFCEGFLISKAEFRAPNPASDSEPFLPHSNHLFTFSTHPQLCAP